MAFTAIRRNGSVRISLALSGLLLAALLVCTGARCRAAEAGSGAYWPGFRNFMAGVVPPKPGLYLRNDVLGYTATAPRVVLNGFPVKNADLTAVLDIIEPEYVLPHKLWGANHAIVITQAFPHADLSGAIIGPNLKVSGSGFAPADTIVSPLFLGWQKKNLYYNSNLAIFVPTGDFNIHRVVNLSRNFWTFDLELGVTQFDPKVGWDFSGVLGYSINTQNAATHYRSGDVLHFDYAIGKVLKNRLKPGLVGYAWVQVGPDRGAGAIFGSFKSQVYGIGPAVEFPISPNADLTLRYYHEFGAVNHLEGDQAALSFRMSF